MKTTIDTLRKHASTRLRRETMSAAAICIVLVTGGALTATESLPALSGTTSTSAFLSGAVMGPLRCRRRDHHQEYRRSAPRAFRRPGRCVVSTPRRTTSSRPIWSGRSRGRSSQIMPALAVVAIFVGALVSLEAMASAAATLVFLSVALLVVKAVYKMRLHSEIGDVTE